MKKVVILKSRLNFMGGLERYAIYLANAFASKGCQVTLLTTHLPFSYTTSFRIESLYTKPHFAPFGPWLFHKACQKWLKNNPQDIVFSLDRTPCMTHYRAGNGAHSTFLDQKNDTKFKKVKSYFNLKNHLILRLEKKMFSNQDLKLLITNSNMVKKQLQNLYSHTQKKIQVIHNGVDIQKFKPHFEKSYRSLPLKLLFVGNDYQRKGLAYLLKALKPLSHEPFELMVIGKDRNPHKYQKLAKSYGLDSKVHFLGAQKSLLPYYKEAQVLILPTFYDPFASVILEAMAMGIYVITSSYNGASEIIEEGLGSILKNLKDPSELTFYLKECLKNPLSLEKRRNIRKCAEKYDLETQLDKMVDLTLQNL